MKKTVFVVAIILVFLTGLTILLYPYVSGYINNIRQSRVVASYHSGIETLSENDIAQQLDAAREYNIALQRKSNRFILSDEEMEEYLELLNPLGNGVMGTLAIDKINVNLPIYHGTNEGVLRVGAGHLEGTSLPVGGIGTHSVITGHRGLPSSILLTELDKMEVGDTFVLHVLSESLTYIVDQIIVVEPHEMDALAIEGDKDYCTLVTCTPYGINSHRMLVRGQRYIEDNEAVEEVTTTAQPQVQGDASSINSILVSAVIVAPVLVIVAVVFSIRVVKLHGRRRMR